MEMTSSGRNMKLEVTKRLEAERVELAGFYFSSATYSFNDLCKSFNLYAYWFSVCKMCISGYQ